MNNRQAIKSAIKSALTTKNAQNQYKTAAADRVYTNRFMPLPADDDDYKLPAICVYVINESVTEQDNVTERRVAEIVIECIADDPNDTALDSLTNQVEAVLIQDETLGGTVDTLTLTRVEIGYDEESKTDIRAGKMTYDGLYYAPKVANSPTDSFETADIQYNDGDFSDEVTLP